MQNARFAAVFPCNLPAIVGSAKRVNFLPPRLAQNWYPKKKEEAAIMKRYIYAFDTLESARAAVEALRSSGLDEKHISLVARSDIQLDSIPDRLLDPSMDFVPALARGATIGGATGLFAGIVATAIPALGIVLGGPALIGFLAGGALVGAWSSALVGSAIPDAIRRTFENEIEAGRTLLVVDSVGADEVFIQHVMSQGQNSHLLWQSDSTKATAA
jgi:hypothetical protein